MVWKPRVTVATLVADNDRYLLVEEDVGLPETVFNQPAGHLESGESLIDAAIRETLEETGYHFTPSTVTGIYRWINPETGDTYLRVCFTGDITGHDSNRTLDQGIVAPRWLTLAEIENLSPRLRSPLVQRCINDYRAGHRYPLSVLVDMDYGE